MTCRHPRDEGCEHCGVDPYSGEPVRTAAATAEPEGYGETGTRHTFACTCVGKARGIHSEACPRSAGVERHTFAEGVVCDDPMTGMLESFRPGGTQYTFAERPVVHDCDPAGPCYC